MPASIYTPKIRTISEWLCLWRSDADQATDLLIHNHEQLMAAWHADDAPQWIYLAPLDDIKHRIEQLKKSDSINRPLYGVPFAVKDNMDVAGMPTTAGCPEFAFTPEHDAFVVAQLLAAGAICIGKTNLDQFATGLNGTRTPFGTPHSVFNDAYVSGGSSSGSAVAVALGEVAFALGTDTAGSGRVPAGFNNLVGLKPTRGFISTGGVVPACRTLDCVSIFAHRIVDAEAVLTVAGVYDAADPYARRPLSIPYINLNQPLRLATFSSLEWFGDAVQQAAWQAYVGELATRGMALTEIDPAPFFALAPLLYNGPWVAERLTAIFDFATNQPESIHPVVREIVLSGAKFSAVDTFKAEYERTALTRQIHEALAPFDALIVPTTPTFPTIEAMRAEPIQRNSELGTYTNFVNLADLSALAIPANFRTDGLPFGVTLIAEAWADKKLADIGRVLNQETKPANENATVQPHEIALAVVGAHLTGMPLNHQLTSRHGRLLKTTTTAATYRLYALANTTPPKPGLVFDSSGAAIAVEVWAIPRTLLADFLQDISAPLGLGTLTLADGSSVTGFICEPRARDGARDITELGGWRAYIASRQMPPLAPQPKGITHA
ncbi:MAG TPA: allophanate hydrolase [Halothiobacillus sp.]|nr:MAG: allophanate hydrolase [Halothiobacillus sp. 20-54-6]HQT43249.1 allophanate hydrolase [Halothiobacillus sp.]